MADLPGHVCLVEVGPRAVALPVAARSELVERLLAAGLRDVHLGEASHDAVVTLLAGLPRAPGLSFPVRVGDADALERALAVGATEIELVVATSQRLCRALHAASHTARLDRLAPLADLALAHGVRLRGLARAAVVCPLTGPLAPARAAELCRDLADLGCYEVCLGEDTGEAEPDALRAVWDACAGRVGADRLAVRLRAGRHARRGLRALLPRGLQTVDTALGGLDGQPAGTLATEDVADLLASLEVATWVDAERLAAAAWWLGGRLGRAPARRPTRHRALTDAPTP